MNNSNTKTISLLCTMLAIVIGWFLLIILFTNTVFSIKNPPDPIKPEVTNNQSTENTKNGRYGIGIYIAKDPNTNQYYISSFSGSSPAYARGMAQGDIIKSIDKHDVSNYDISAIQDLIAGEYGTYAEIGVQRPTGSSGTASAYVSNAALRYFSVERTISLSY